MSDMWTESQRQHLQEAVVRLGPDAVNEVLDAVFYSEPEPIRRAIKAVVLDEGASEIIIIGHRSDCQRCWADMTGLLAHVQDAYAMIGDDTQREYIEAIKRHMEWMSDALAGGGDE